MKKLIRILGFVAIVFALFANTNSITKTSSSITLADLMSMNNANAEDDCPWYENCDSPCGNWIWGCDTLYSSVSASCECEVSVEPGGVGIAYTIPGSTEVCESGGPDFCTPSYVCICGYI